jgi:hypothetical protein
MIKCEVTREYSKDASVRVGLEQGKDSWGGAADLEQAAKSSSRRLRKNPEKVRSFFQKDATPLRRGIVGNLVSYELISGGVWRRRSRFFWSTPLAICLQLEFRPNQLVIHPGCEVSTFCALSVESAMFPACVWIVISDGGRQESSSRPSTSR